MVENTDRLSTTFAALADPTRRGILLELAKGDATVQDLARPYDMSMAAVSKHLKVLEAAGLITRGKRAQYRPCHLDEQKLEAATAWLDDFRRFWDRSLDSLDHYLKELKKEGKHDASRKKSRR